MAPKAGTAAAASAKPKKKRSNKVSMTPLVVESKKLKTQTAQKKKTQHQATLESFFGAAASSDSNAGAATTTTNVAAAAAAAAAGSPAGKRKAAPVASNNNNNNNNNSSSNKNTSNNNATTSKQQYRYMKTPYTGGDHLPVLTEPQHMFDDMVHRLLKQSHDHNKLASLVQKLCHRPLKLCTMCSGTESPLLALDMLQKAIQEACHDYPELLNSNTNDGGDSTTAAATDTVFQLEHVFSCEIEPFKQAYIERNFHPALLFRDIRELGNEFATTAYGARVKVPNSPGTVDVLIAGTSCVDYSNLNNAKKTLEEQGESGSTFVGMIEWIKKCLPLIVILENVFGAPWDKKVKMFAEIGYSATYLKLDTKDFYIPHTRQRGYLFAIRKPPSPKNGRIKLDSRPQQWINLVKQMKRPASATLDAFLLSDDDPRVLRGRARLTAESSSADHSTRAGRTDWTKCETRHLAARSLEELGDQRPLTGWSDSGHTTLPGQCWNEWANVQVNRIHDLLDINTLRLATDGVDPMFKTMVWNLSQNVDRDTMGRLGLCQCLTPTGVPYLTNRGGPMVGEELLMLQGIPADDLLLTKESEDNLKDLAGNAMSTTIVGACTLAALLVGHSSLSDGVKSDNGDGDEDDHDGKRGGSSHIVRSLVPRALIPVSNEVSISKQFGKYENSTVDLSPRVLGNESAWKMLLAEADSSARKCVSEGLEECIPLDRLVECRECGQTSSTANAFPPRKYCEHNFAPVDPSTGPRAEPSAFRRKLLEYLPMRVRLDGFDLENLEQPKNADPVLFKKWVKACQHTFANEFLLENVIRSHIWTTLYRNASGGRLEGRVSKHGVTWLLFAKAPTKASALKARLEQPIAKMTVSTPSSGSISLLDGEWEFCLPVTSAVTVSIEGVGDTVPSWRARLGLKKGTFESERQYETLRVQVKESEAEAGCFNELKKIVDADYKILPKCGGACGSLMKKVCESATLPTKEGDVFFFLDSGRKTLPKDDVFVFASSCHRTAHGEFRELILQIDPLEQYRTEINKTENDSDGGYKVEVKALLPGLWVATENATLKSMDTDCRMNVSLPLTPLAVPMCQGAWKICPELISCTVKVAPTEDVFVRCEKAGGSAEVYLQKSKKILTELAFATSRLEIPDLWGNDQWLDLKQMQSFESDEDALCIKCSPKPPTVKWHVVTKGKRAKFCPIEDGREAAVYERALKERPEPWIIRLGIESENEPSLSLTISCNAVSLVQRALGLFPTNSLVRKSMIKFAKSGDGTKPPSDQFQFGWRVVPHVEIVAAVFPKLTFSSNRHDREAEQPPNFSKYKLRKEQLRSLTWMLQQESSTDPFFEEEVAEAVLPNLNWRAEGRVRRPVLVRAGVVADEVGYGKTAITLALIDASETEETQDAHGSSSCGLIPTKATLVVVPKHLMGQWPDEVFRFLGKSKSVIVIKDLSSLNKVSIRDIQDADIVICSFAVLSNEKYFTRLARFSHVNPTSVPTGTNGGRLFTAVYNECLEALPDRVSEIVKDCSAAYNSIEEAAASHTQQKAAGTVRLDGKKAVYKMGASASQMSAAGADVKLATSERDPWGLSHSKAKYKDMKSAPLELFFWKRLVVDEFTYLGKKDREKCLSVIKKVTSKFRWLLSGTPSHKHFNDIRDLADLMGIYLGVEDDLPGTKISSKHLADKESTGLESLSSFLESRSMQWHLRRHSLAQTFLDRFVRQNIAEIDEIPFEEHECLVELPPAERAIYLELETHLNSLEMNSKSAQKSKRKSTGDRESRMQKILQDSETGEEALLKCCSHFNFLSSNCSALETVDKIIEVRKEEMKSLEKEMVQWITDAFQQRQRILVCQPDWMSVTATEKGEVIDALGNYLGQVNDNGSVPHGADGEVNDRVRDIVNEAKACFDKDPRPTKCDSFFPDKNEGSANEEDDDDGGSEEPSKKKQKKKQKEPTKKVDPVCLFTMKQALRNHMHGVRSLSKELCGRFRSLRYIQHIRRFQQQETGFECAVCKNTQLNVSDVGVLSCCGHAGCLSDLRKLAAEGRCVVSLCTARVSPSHVLSAEKFGSSETDVTGRFGRKLSAVAKKVKQIVEEQGDRVVVFCQFDGLSDKVKESLSDRGIVSVEVKGTVAHQISTISVFQKEKPAKGDPRVLLLKMDDEQSAGLNLTNLNHAVFVHPLLAGSQEEYDAYETQAIGRLRRYGQKKTVHVWRFLAKDTIDTSVFSQRSSRLIPETEFSDS